MSAWVQYCALGNNHNPTTYPANLRLSLSQMTEQQWLVRARGAYRPPMPGFNLRAMTDADLRAIYRYVKPAAQGPARAGIRAAGQSGCDALFRFHAEKPAEKNGFQISKESTMKEALEHGKPGQCPRKTRELHNPHFDSTIWNDFDYRDDDIVIATYAKSGTTWMQQIVSQLLFKGAEGLEVAEMSPWLDLRVPPKDIKLPAVKAQAHRRFVKTHLPVDALVFSPQAKYLSIGRDGRTWQLEIPELL